MTVPESVLILAAHGSSHGRAKAALAAFAERVQREHPDVRVLCAHTAGQSPHALRTDVAPGMEEALHALAQTPDGTPKILRVQSLHVIAGREFDRMRALSREFAKREGWDVAVAGPLLSCAADAPLVAEALIESMTKCMMFDITNGMTVDSPDATPGAAPAARSATGEAVVLMGHGTTHGAQELYRCLAARLTVELPLARLGVMETANPHSSLSIQAIAHGLAEHCIRRARLIPFLTVAGRHAHNDLAGDQPGSWKSILAERGIEGIPDLAGLIERDTFVRLWLNSVRTLLNSGANR